MEIDRILQKIKKCFALSASPNANESAAAMRQAQKLMAMHNIDEATLALVDYGTIRISLPVQATNKIPMWLDYYMGMLRSCFGVTVTYNIEMRVSDYSYVMNMHGPKHRIAVAEYAHNGVWKAMTRAYTAHLRDNPWDKGVRGGRTSFYVGFISTVRSQVAALSPTSQETALTAQYVLEWNGGEIEVGKASKCELDGRAMLQGRAAADGFSLNIGVGANKPNPLQLEQ